MDATSRRAYGLVLVAALSYTLLMFVWFSLPAHLSAIIADLGLTGTQVGVVVETDSFSMNSNIHTRSSARDHGQVRRPV